MSSISVEFTFNGVQFDGVFSADIPLDDLILLGLDLIDHIEEDSDNG